MVNRNDDTGEHAGRHSTVGRVVMVMRGAARLAEVSAAWGGDIAASRMLGH